MTPLSHGIALVDAHYVQPGIAGIYLMAQAGKVSIIETGTVHSIPHIFSALEQLGFTAEDVEYVIPTHIHLDHAGGAGELMERCPNAELVIHPRGAQHMIDPAKLEAGTKAVYGEEKYRALYGSLKPIDQARVIQAPDDFVLDFNGRTLHFIDTPGHALHHFCIYDTLSQGIFTGDSFGLAYQEIKSPESRFIFATTTPVHFDPIAMLKTIDKLMVFKPSQMYLTHFGGITPSEDIVSQLKKSVNAFAEIANAELNKTGDRVERLEKNIMDWLWTEIQAGNYDISELEVNKLLRSDCHLNAQGLDVWLKRKEKLAAK